MLTIEEINKELCAQVDLKIECFDFTGFINNQHYKAVMCDLSENPTVTVKRVRLEEGIVEIIDARYICIEILSDQLQFFRIKHPAPTFDDLIDVLIKAKKDNIVSRVEINCNSLNATVNLTDSKGAVFCTSKDAGGIVFKERIDWINSLYTETFVIDDYKDIKNIKKQADINLANGLKVKAYDEPFRHGEGWKVRCANGQQSGILDIFALKGATVTQSEVLHDSNL